MGKRSPGQFERKPRDLYPTPDEAIWPLLPYLKPGTRFIEPCAGDGRMIEALQIAGHVCVGAFDIEPQDECIKRNDATTWKRAPNIIYDDFMLITNPPWRRSILHEIIVNLYRQHPTWLLFDADWMHTKQAIPFLSGCHKVVSVGRVKWEPDSKHQGKDNCAWYLFADRPRRSEIEFHGRFDNDKAA